MDKHCEPVAGQPRPALTVLCISIALALAGIGSPQASAVAADLPQGGQVIGGQANIRHDGQAMQIDTASERTAIDWHSFNVGPNNQVTFNQPNGKSVTLNRVLGGDPSKVYGAVTSNGQLILVNPAGVWVGPNAHIASSALVASAGFLTDEQARQFAATGKLDIQLSGQVANHGRITVHDNGMVALLGAQVVNAGVIQARKGRVQLASGPQATLDFHGDGLLNIAIGGAAGERDSVNADVTGGVHNSGEIDVGNGIVAISAAQAARHLDSVINLGGKVSADAVSDDGGTIVLGNAARTHVDGTLSATGSNGGSIRVQGNYVNIASSARLDASGSQGQGGKVVVIGDQVTHFAGTASATGSTRGGVVETSGKQLTVSAQAKVDTRGAKANGTWLLDPETVNIDDTGNAGSVAASSIVSNLALGNVVVQATDTINVNAPIIATNLASVDNDGRRAPATLALIASGNPGLISTYEGADKSHANGAVNIRAPILLKDGNLYISATGDIRLIDDAPAGATGAGAYARRAIIDVGSGIAWLRTTDTASIFQHDNTALIAGHAALEGASVRMDSGLNHAGVLAGKASNGIFTFSQTNATGTGPDTRQAVTAPLTGETLSGVKAYALTAVGTQLVMANGEVDRQVNLAPGNGQTFDYVVFEAVNLRDENGNEIPQADVLRYLDSSDYLLYGISFRDADGALWQFKPNPDDVNAPIVTRNGEHVGVPVGFSLSPVNGTLAVGVLTGTGYWGVDGEYLPGPANQHELQYKPATDTSEQLVFKLQGQTDALLAQIGWLADDRPWMTTSDDKPISQRSLLETARVQFLSTQDKTDSNVSLTSHQARITATPVDVSREYGEQNPALGQRLDSSGATTEQVRGIDQYVDAQLGRSGVTLAAPSTSATQSSDVGQYSIDGGISGDAFATQRYTLHSDKGTLTVTPAQLTVTAKDKHKVYGDQDPALEHEVTGAKLGQAASDLLQGALQRQAGENTGRYGIGQGNLVLSSGNYSMVFKDGELTITPAPLQVRADDKAKALGTADPALTYQLGGLKNGDNASIVQGSLQRAPGEDVGAYAIGQGSTFQAGNNYTVTFHDGVLTIDGPLAPLPPEPQIPADDPPAPQQPPQPPQPEAAAGDPPLPAPPAQPGVPANALPMTAQSPGNTRCTALESPSAVSANYTVSPAVARTYTVQLICKPRAYGDGTVSSVPDIHDVLSYANSHFKDGRFIVPDWNRNVMPRDLKAPEKGGR
nr:MBG domain-containing protein [uncultured Pseudomonas sp.]